MDFVDFAVRRKARHDKACQSARGLRQHQEGVAHRRRHEPFVPGDAIGAAAIRFSARHVGAHVGAALLLGHPHAHGHAALGRPWRKTRIIGAGAEHRHDLLQQPGIGGERANRRPRHGDRAQVPGLDLGGHEEFRGPDHLGAIAGQGALGRPGRIVQAGMRAVRHQLMIGRMEFDLVAPKPLGIEQPQLRRVLIRDTAALRHRRRAPMTTEGGEIIARHRACGHLHRVHQRPVQREQVDVLERRRLVEDIVGGKRLRHLAAPSRAKPVCRSAYAEPPAISRRGFGDHGLGDLHETARGGGQRTPRSGDQRQIAMDHRCDQRHRHQIGKLQQRHQIGRQHRHAESVRGHRQRGIQERGFQRRREGLAHGPERGIDQSADAGAGRHRDRREAVEFIPTNLGPPFECAIARRGRAQPVADQGFERNVRMVILDSADAELRLTGQDFGDQLIGGDIEHLDPDLGIGLAKRLQDAWHQGRGDTGGHRKRDTADGLVLQGAHVIGDALHLAEDALHGGDGLVRGPGRIERAGGAVEQPRLPDIFQLAHQQADRGLGQMHLGRGPRQAAEPVGVRESFQLPKGDIHEILF